METSLGRHFKVADHFSQEEGQDNLVTCVRREEGSDLKAVFQLNKG